MALSKVIGVIGFIGHKPKAEPVTMKVLITPSFVLLKYVENTLTLFTSGYVQKRGQSVRVSTITQNTLIPSLNLTGNQIKNGNLKGNTNILMRLLFDYVKSNTINITSTMLGNVPKLITTKIQEQIRITANVVGHKETHNRFINNIQQYCVLRSIYKTVGILREGIKVSLSSKSTAILQGSITNKVEGAFNVKPISNKQTYLNLNTLIKNHVVIIKTAKTNLLSQITVSNWFSGIKTYVQNNIVGNCLVNDVSSYTILRNSRFASMIQIQNNLRGCKGNVLLKSYVLYPNVSGRISPIRLGDMVRLELQATDVIGDAVQLIINAEPAPYTYDALSNKYYSNYQTASTGTHLVSWLYGNQVIDDSFKVEEKDF